MGLPSGCLVTFFSYVPRCLYPDTYPEVSTMSSRPALPFPRPVESKRSLCDPVNLVVSVRRLTVGEATALWEDIWDLGFLTQHFSLILRWPDGARSAMFVRLTVTPEMIGDFPSTSLKISASASSPLFSLYFFLASSASAILNSSYVMLRQDFFLKCGWKREINQERKHLQLVSAGLCREASKLKMYTQPWDRVNLGDVRQQG